MIFLTPGLGTIDIDFFNTIGIGIDIDKAIFKLLVLVLILIRSSLNY